MFLRYKWETGMLAWAMHRLTGIAITFYLVLHVYTVSKLHLGPDYYDHAIKLFSTPLFKTFEALLWGACVYHGLNGIRVILIDFAGAARKHETIFYVLMGIAAVLFAVGGWMIIAPALG